jgi:lipoprotein-anchoring transpeptidase ErfK/SrfK
MSVYAGGKLIASSLVSTGKEGYSTPTGVFSILQKRKFHRSNIYSRAPMPFMQRLTWSGIALHGSNQVPDYPGLRPQRWCKLIG